MLAGLVDHEGGGAGGGVESCADEVEALVDGGSVVADGEGGFAEGGDVGDSCLEASLSACGVYADPGEGGDGFGFFDGVDVVDEGDAGFLVFVCDPEGAGVVEGCEDDDGWGADAEVHACDGLGDGGGVWELGVDVDLVVELWEDAVGALWS